MPGRLWQIAQYVGGESPRRHAPDPARASRASGPPLSGASGQLNSKKQPGRRERIHDLDAARLSCDGEAEKRIRIVHRLYPDIHRA